MGATHCASNKSAPDRPEFESVAKFFDDKTRKAFGNYRQEITKHRKPTTLREQGKNYRIKTCTELLRAMILAIALGIAIDDTIHFMIRLHKETTLMKAAEHCVRRAVSHVGRAIIYTSVVLILGFISMISNDLIAIRDMGIVAAVTVGVALFSDVYLAPALFLLASGTSRTPRLGVQHTENGDDFLSHLTQRIPSPCRVRRPNTD
ncbi:MAG: MMPL family transporter [Acidiferrobacterales bacterium]